MSSRPPIVVWAVIAVIVGGCADDSRRAPLLLVSDSGMNGGSRTETDGMSAMDAAATQTDSESSVGDAAPTSMDRGTTPSPDAQAVDDAFVADQGTVDASVPAVDAFTCAVGEILCGDTCVNTADDPEHCGACGFDCGPNAIADGACSEGVCQCIPGWAGGACGETVCGDGLVVGDEQCDDGNLSNRDACSTTCRSLASEQCAEDCDPTATHTRFNYRYLRRLTAEEESDVDLRVSADYGFGSEISIEGNTALISFPGAGRVREGYLDRRGQPQTRLLKPGRVDVMERFGDAWLPVDSWRPWEPDDEDRDDISRFGRTLMLKGNLAFVVATRLTARLELYIYKRENGEWSLFQRIPLLDGVPDFDPLDYDDTKLAFSPGCDVIERGVCDVLLVGTSFNVSVVSRVEGVDE